MVEVLCLVGSTRTTTTRTGIQRVVVSVVTALAASVDIQLAKWDPRDDQLRYFDADDLTAFFDTCDWPAGIRVHQYAHRLHYRFGDTLRSTSTWLLMPEIFYHSVDGIVHARKAISQAREYGLPCCAIFYDLIPITNADYRDFAECHRAYVLELLRLDLIVPISHFSADVLRAYICSELQSQDSIKDVPNILPIALAMRAQNSSVAKSESSVSFSDKLHKDIIAVLGTVEPRKGQLSIVNAFKHLNLGALGFKLLIVGSLHPDVAAEFHRLIDDDLSIVYRGHATDKEIQSIFARSRFSIFASVDEGFGLPISESLSANVPCLCADFGAMKEVGSGGGCMMVNVADGRKLEEAILALSTNDGLIRDLKHEIGARNLTTWRDYAAELLTLFSRLHPRRYDRLAEDRILRALELHFSDHTSASDWDTTVDVAFGDKSFDWRIVRPEALPALEENLGECPRSNLAVCIPPECDGLRHLRIGATASLFDADCWIAGDIATYQGLIALAAKSGHCGLLPTLCFCADSHDGLLSAAQAMVELSAAQYRRHTAAQTELSYRRAKRAIVGANSVPSITIAISTYNRAAFVKKNVHWVLKLLEQGPPGLKLLVVDNCSRDGTDEALSGFIGHPKFELVVNAANTGMLGNLRVCASHITSDYAWVIGDDDFITPRALRVVSHELQRAPGLPLAFLNFGVYHRETLAPDDAVEGLLRECIPLAPGAVSTGVYRTTDIAIQHDNLFTAIYPIVFRSDVLSSCFNYPFSGQPFSSLVESVPTTKLILDTYAATEALWINPICIVGNTHNSWRHYRVAWHGTLMPVAFELARRARIDNRKLYEWAQCHRVLLAEAEELYPPVDGDHISFGVYELSARQRVFRSLGVPGAHLSSANSMSASRGG